MMHSYQGNTHYHVDVTALCETIISLMISGHLWSSGGLFLLMYREGFYGYRLNSAEVPTPVEFMITVYNSCKIYIL